MPETVMLVLIGGRSAVPAIAGILQFLNEVDKIKYLLCKGNQYLQFYKNVKLVIEQERKDLVCNDETDVAIVDPNKFDEVYEAVKELCRGVEQVKYVNLTSVPQTMAISVYSYIQEMYKDVLVFSVNTDQSQIIPLIFGMQPVSFSKKITVENYIAMCGYRIFKSMSYESSKESIIRYFIENLEISTRILSVIRSNGDTIKAPKTFTMDFTRLGFLNNELEDFFQTLEKAAIIKNLKISSNKVKFRIETNADYAFLAGGWLEMFVYMSSQQCGFDSIELGCELDNYRGQIDVFSLNNANAMICECKTGSKLESRYLSALSAKAEKLGGNYCVKLFITSKIQVEKEFINAAENNRIVVVSGKQFTEMTEILAREMQSPTYARR